MSDRFPAEIHIGGEVRRGLVPDLCAVIGDQNVGLEYGEHDFKPTDEAALLATVKDGRLSLYHEEVAWGQFDDLEEFLREHGIPFDRKSDGRYEYDPENVSFRPGKGNFGGVANKSGNEVVEVASVRPVLERLQKELAKEGDCPLSSIRRGARQLKKLLKQLPPETPPLPKFEVVGK